MDTVSDSESIEPELQQRVPRRVRYDGPRNSVFIVIIIGLAILMSLGGGEPNSQLATLFGILGFCWFMNALHEERKHKRLVRNGVAVRGTALSKERHQADKRREIYTYTVRYAFLLGDKVIQDEIQVFDVALWNSIEVQGTLWQGVAGNSALTVLYDPEHPTRNVLYCAAQYKAIPGEAAST